MSVYLWIRRNRLYMNLQQNLRRNIKPSIELRTLLSIGPMLSSCSFFFLLIIVTVRCLFHSIPLRHSTKIFPLLFLLFRNKFQLLHSLLPNTIQLLIIFLLLKYIGFLSQHFPRFSVWFHEHFSLLNNLRFARSRRT